MKAAIKILPILFLIFAFLCTCKKSSLTVPPLGELLDTQVNNKRGIEKLLVGAYSLLDGRSVNTATWGSASSNWLFGSICGGEAYKGSENLDQLEILAVEKFTTLPANQYVADKWKAVYWGVQRANDVLRILKIGKNISHTDSVEFAAEARFLRGHYHFEAKKMWNNIPFVDENVTYLDGNYYIANDTSWKPIENDLLYAATNLPTSQREIGRVNFYTAEALLAKVYLFQHKYYMAQPLLKDVIENGTNSSGVRFQLLPKYGDIFDPAFKNASESIFLAQTSVNDGSFGDNGNYGDALNFPMGDPTYCCGFFQPSQYLVNHFKTDSITGLPDLDHFNDSDVTNDQGIESFDDNYTSYKGTLDPRLDWTVSRRGIPYLDWGINPGKIWVRDPNQAWGPYSPIKSSYYKSELNAYVETNSWGNIFTANSIKFIRLADVLLMAAEVEVEIGSIDLALNYVNQVRLRAENPDGYVHTYINPDNPGQGFTNTPAAHYFIRPYPDGSFSDKEFARKAIRYERMLELGMEGHRFFDLVRWGMAETELSTYLTKEQTLRPNLTGWNFTKNVNEYFPIPQIQIQLSAGQDGIRKLIQNPGY